MRWSGIAVDASGKRSLQVKHSPQIFLPERTELSSAAAAIGSRVVAELTLRERNCSTHVLAGTTTIRDIRLPVAVDPTGKIYITERVRANFPTTASGLNPGPL